MKTKHLTFRSLLLPLALLAASAAAIQFFALFAAHQQVVESMRSLESAFPQNTSVPVEVQLTSGSSEVLTPRDQREQVRDWLLLTVLTSAGLSPEKLNEVTFDLPPVRYNFMKPVGEWEYGEARSRAIGNGTVVALIPRDAGVRRTGLLCDIADQNRKNLGQIPTRIVVMEYGIDDGLESASITRQETMDGHALFTAETGYTERTVKTLSDFEAFQNSIDDLTYSAVRDGAMVLGGRRIPGRAIRGIRVEDVAALWQGEDKLSAAAAALKTFIDQKDAELKARWENRTYQTGDVAEEARLKNLLERDRAEVREEINIERIKRKAADSLGFSLDPTYDYAKMASFVEEYLPDQPADPSKVEKASALRYSIDNLDSPGASYHLPDAEVSEVVSSLRAGKTTKFFDAMQKLKDGDSFYSVCETRFGMQAARYDGDLQYTEPGMVLFYTDLLAKLWALNYGHSSPEKEIEDFVPLTRVKVSPVFRTELRELSRTRLWFGPQNKGFQISANNEVLLSRIATRLYAASATSLKQGEESAPNAESAAFLGWWDDHFQEVASYEPEYERLNQIMKWSLVLGWLHHNNELQDLSFLRGVHVERNNWFPEWARRQTNLRFHQWDQVPFFAKGSFGLQTEGLPRLKSEVYQSFGESSYLSGGVSLASEETFAERPLLSNTVEEGLRRSNLRYTDGLGNDFKTLENVEYSLTREERDFDVSVTPSAEMRLRGRMGELANQPLDRKLETAFDNNQFRVRVADTDIGSLNINRTANGFKVGWASRDVDKGYALGRRLSVTKNIPAALAGDSDVLASASVPDGYVARLRGSDRWVHLAVEPQASVTLEHPWQARVASVDGNAQSIKIQWVDDAWVKQNTGAAHYDEMMSRTHSSVTPGDEVVDDISRRDFPKAADRIAADPLKMWADMDTVYRTQLSHADDLIRSGKPEEAARYLEQMRQTWGSTSDISLLHAYALADSHDLAGAARVMNRPVMGTERDANPVYEELNRRIALSAAAPDRQTYETLRAAGEWKHFPTGGTARVGREKDGLALEYHLSAAKGQPATVDQVLRSGSPIYVQDSPQLRNMDWSVNVQQSLRQAVDGDLATLVRLGRTDVAHFRPAKIYAPEDQAVLRKYEQTSSHAGQAGRNAYQAYQSSNCYASTGQLNDPASSGCPQDQQAVYLVVPKGSESRYE